MRLVVYYKRVNGENLEDVYDISKFPPIDNTIDV